MTLYKLRLSQSNLILLILLVVLGTSLIVSSNLNGKYLTTFFFIFISFAGLYICNSTQFRLNDKKLSILKNLWLIKLIIILLIVKFIWIKNLDDVVDYNNNYDAVKYYFNSWNLVQSGWQLESGINYKGIYYYYGFIFYLLDFNAYIPALINSFISLLAINHLIFIFYNIYENNKNKRYLIAYLLLIPEIIWYDSITGKDSILASLIVFSSLKFFEIYYLENRKRLFDLILIFISLLVIVAIRPVIIIPIVMIYVSIILFINSKIKSFFRYTLFFFVIIAVYILFESPQIQENIGGSSTTFISDLKGTLIPDDISQKNWNDQSIGSLLIPQSFIESVILIFPRMILYTVSPLPYVNISLNEIILPQLNAWLRIFSIISAILNVFVLPYVLAGTFFAINLRSQNRYLLIIPIIFWILFISVSGGNVIIHERYRAMYDLFFFSSALIGYLNCSKRTINKYFFFWFLILLTLLLFFIAYKSL